MSEAQTSGEQPQATPVQPQSKPRRRWFVRTAVIIIVLLALFVILLPSIVSMGWVRSLALSKVNEQLNGEILVDDWSFGWFSGARIRNVRIVQDDATILEVGEVATDLNLFRILTGRGMRLGKTTVTDLAFAFVRYPDGTNNFARLAKVPADPNAPMPELPAGLSMQFSGNLRGVIEQRHANGSSETAYLDPSDISASFSDINAAINTSIKLALRAADGQSGSFVAEGKIRLFDKGRVALEKIDGDLTVIVSGIDLGIANAFLPPGLPVDTLSGQAEGKFGVTVSGTDSVVAEGGLSINDFSMAGPALGNDVYKNPRITLALPPTTISRSGAARVRIGRSGKAETLMLTIEKHGSVAISVDTSLDALSNLAANKAPGDTGELGLQVNLDLAAVANQIPHALRLREGLRLTGGTLENRIQVNLAKDKATFSQNNSIKGLVGEIDGKSVSAQAVSVVISADNFGGGGAIPDLRNIAIDIGSGFATAKGGGENLSRLRLTGNVKLADLASQLGQFIDLAGMGIASLSGDADFNLITSTDPAKPSSPTTLDATLTTTKLTALRVNPGGQPLPLLSNFDSTSKLAATFSQSESGQVVQVTSLNLSNSAGLPTIAKDPATPFTINLPVKGPPSITGKLTIEGNMVSIGDFLAGLSGPTTQPPAAKITGGSLAATLELGRSGGVTNIALGGGINGLSVTLPGQPIRNETVRFAVAANVNDALTAISVPSLDLKSSFATAVIEQPIAITLGGLPGGSATGAIVIQGQVKPIMAIAESLQLAAPNSLVNYGGNFVINKKFSTSGNQLVAAVRMVVNDFTVGDPARPSFKEAALQIAGSLRLDQSAKSVDIQRLSLEMTQTKAVSLALSGKIQQYDTQGRFDGMVLTLGYDLAAGYNAVRPLLQAGAVTPEQRKLFDDLKVAGVRRDIKIPITGRYPLNDPAALKFVLAQAVVGFDQVEYQGMDIRNYDLPVSLADGKLRTIYADKEGDARFAKPGQANDGTIDLSGWELSLIERPMRLSCMRENYTLLNKVNIQEKSLAHFLGSISPIFYGTSKAKGIMNVTVLQVRNLPLDASILQDRNDPNSIAKAAFSITDMGIKAPFVDLLAAQLGLKTQDGMVPMQLHDGAVALADGVVDSTMKLDIGGQTLSAEKAVISLSDKKILAMYMGIPKTMLPEAARQDFFKDVIVVPVAGTLGSPSFNIVEAATRSVDPAALVTGLLTGRRSKSTNLLGDGLGGLVGKGQSDSKSVASPTAAPKAVQSGAGKTAPKAIPKPIAPTAKPTAKKEPIADPRQPAIKSAPPSVVHPATQPTTRPVTTAKTRPAPVRK